MKKVRFLSVVTLILIGGAVVFTACQKDKEWVYKPLLFVQMAENKAVNEDEKDGDTRQATMEETDGDTVMMQDSRAPVGTETVESSGEDDDRAGVDIFDTADFVRIMLDDQPFSVEVMGRPRELNDSVYVLFVQAGVYGSPDFSLKDLSFYPDSVQMTMYGVKPVQSVVSDGSGQPPWEAFSIHHFVFQRDSLEEGYRRNLISSVVRPDIRINLDGYVRYGDKRVDIPVVMAYDPWFGRMQEEEE